VEACQIVFIVRPDSSAKPCQALATSDGSHFISCFWRLPRFVLRSHDSAELLPRVNDLQRDRKDINMMKGNEEKYSHKHTTITMDNS